jgi:hypothetical protein
MIDEYCCISLINKMAVDCRLVSARLCLVKLGLLSKLSHLGKKPLLKMETIEME